VQEALKGTFPEFGSKAQLINYYVSFDFPEKQMKMVGWWQRVIDFLIEHEHQVYITYQQLAAYLSVYNLKPTPLPAILNHLANRQLLGPEHEYEVRQTLKEAEQKEKSFLGSMMGYFSKPAAKEPIFFQCQGSEKIFSRKIKEFKKQHLRKELEGIFTEHCKAITQYKLSQQLEERVHLDRDSVSELLRELDREDVLRLMEHGGKPFVLFSHNAADFQEKERREVEKMKFCLREQIDKFEYMAAREEEKSNKLRERVKELVANGNAKSGKTLCREIV
jgi:hypothetical protein